MFDRDLENLREFDLRQDLAGARCATHDRGVTATITQFESGHFQVQWSSSMCCDPFEQELKAIVNKYQPK